MLFNSYLFIFGLLPIALLGFAVLGRSGSNALVTGWLVLVSFLFYGLWNPQFIPIFLFSILCNYFFGVWISQSAGQPIGRLLLGLGITFNLLLLSYYKYFNFLTSNLNPLLDTPWPIEPIALPLAISFFTFQQIAYLADAHRGLARDPKFIHYCLFVTFFPHLIAGPIVHHKEMMQQFDRMRSFTLQADHLAIGLTLFTIGLFKKVIIADKLAQYAIPVFSAAHAGADLSLLEAWGGALSFTFQIYFDFSGYSDMAIGLSRMFGILLPANFYSPYKAGNIIEFWRRWHMTLSRFLRDYLYIPLGGNQKGFLRRHLNLLITMALGGFWHGAAWTFLAWGLLHGVCLVINHAFQAIRKRWSMPPAGAGELFLSRLLTFLCVVVGWVLFRAEDFDSARRILSGMIGMHGVTLPLGAEIWLHRLGDAGQLLTRLGIACGELHYWYKDEAWRLLLAMVIVWTLPNTQQIMRHHTIVLEKVPRPLEPAPAWMIWSPRGVWATGMGAVALYALFSLTNATEFLYYQF
ncbi:MAG: MBOAT family protein [Magnetococcales bacterium]|nr:MBOAT family protein [Magnetococcales bacterium]